jgi:hypothetical protein
MQPALDWVQRHRKLWTRSLDRLEQFLDADATASRKSARRRGNDTGGLERDGS